MSKQGDVAGGGDVTGFHPTCFSVCTGYTGDMHWRYTLKIYSGDIQWRYTLEQSVTFVKILIRMNVRIYSYQKNYTNEYPNIFIRIF